MEPSSPSSSSTANSRSNPAAGGELNIVVLQADDRHFGLVVDDIHDTEEIVVKPLQKQLKAVTAFSGATIMGDGRVALILDVLGLAQRAGVISRDRERAVSETPAAPAEPVGDRQTVLLCDARGGGRMAIPLAAVSRLEEFPRSAVERVGGQDVIQYRGAILTLVHVSRVLKNGRAAARTGAPPTRPPRTREGRPPRGTKSSSMWLCIPGRNGRSDWSSAASSTSSRRRSRPGPGRRALGYYSPPWFRIG